MELSSSKANWAAIEHWNSTGLSDTKCLVDPSSHCRKRIGIVSTYRVFPPLQEPIGTETADTAAANYIKDRGLLLAELQKQEFGCARPAECANRISAEEFEQL